jgi:hypothetical protein
VHPLGPFVAAASEMTVCIELLDSLYSDGGQIIARLDLTIEESHAQGSFLVAHQPRMELDPVAVKPTDGVLDVFVRLLSYMLS